MRSECNNSETCTKNNCNNKKPFAFWYIDIDSIFTEWIDKPSRCNYKYRIQMKRNHRKVIKSKWSKIKSSYCEEKCKIIQACYNEPNSFRYKEWEIIILSSIIFYFFYELLDFRHTFYIVWSYYIKKCHSHKNKLNILGNLPHFIHHQISRYEPF